MNLLYEFPENAAYGKIMPKSKIYEYVNPATRVKNLFVSEVDKIIWSFKLSPATINLPSSGFVKEIQVITIDLKKNELSNDVLMAIDKTIPSPIIFVLRHENKIRYTAAYKRQSEAGKGKWVISEYFQSKWFKNNSETQALPMALNLKNLYEILMKNLIPIESMVNEGMSVFMSRVERIMQKEREVKKIQAKIKSERQYNRKVELHSQLRNITKEIEALNS